jgi:hypothetical protein
MKRFVLLSIILFLLNGIAGAQYIYNNQHKIICTVRTLSDVEYDIHCGGLKAATVNNDFVFDASGKKIGRVEKDLIFDGSDNVICSVKGKEIYSGGKKAAWVKNNIVYDGAGNQMFSVIGITMTQIAVYIFLVAN